MYALSMNAEYIAKIKYTESIRKVDSNGIRQGSIFFKNGDHFEGGIKKRLASNHGKLILNDMSFFQGCLQSLL